MKLVKILSDSVQIRTNTSEFQNIRINDLLEVSGCNGNRSDGYRFGGAPGRR